MVEKVEVVVSRSPMLSWRWGAKKTVVPSAAAPSASPAEPQGGAQILVL